MLNFIKKDPDSPPVMIHPPVLFGVGFVAGLALNLWLGISFNVGTMINIGYLFLASGFAICAWAVWQLRAAGTNVPTPLPVTALVTSDPFKTTRNPIYIRLAVSYLGLACLLDAPLALFSLLPVLIILHVGVVLREKDYLEKKFGEEYLEYKSRSKRWV